ncbi:hypothetical protein J4526_00765 [Desulfurococcaceae archaeon MEX13E-LK6-19]|nr:hypothetical protein J4526_00765 [Desulfurococcaceae archaeon MEX13E-LK6-19]
MYKTLFVVLLLVLFVVSPILVTYGENDSIRIEVYSDNSVKLYLSGSQEVDFDGTGNIQVEYTFGEDNIRIVFSGELNDVKNTNTVSELTFSFNQSISSNDAVVNGVTDIVFELSSSNGSLILRGNDILYHATKNPPIENYCGEIAIAVEGGISDVLGMFFLFLNELMVEMYLQQAGITWIDISKLSVSTQDGKYIIEFNITVDMDKYAEYAEEYMNLSREDVLGSFNKSFTEGFMEINTVFSLKNSSLKMYFELNTTYPPEVAEEKIGEYSSLNMTWVPGSIELPGWIPFNKTMDIVESEEFQEFIAFQMATAGLIAYAAEEFEVLPSSGSIELSFNNGVMEYSIETPKIRAKGAETPKDTLNALVEFFETYKQLVKSNSVLEEMYGEEVDEMLEKTATVTPGDENVEVEPSTVKLKDLSKVNVTVSETETSTGVIENLVQNPMALIAAAIMIAIIVILLLKARG